MKYAISVALLIATVVLAHAQVALDSFGFQDNSGDHASFNATPITVGTGTQRVLECAALIGGGSHNVTNVAMKWGGTAMTPLAAAPNNNGGKAWAGLFGLVNPASGKLTLSTTWSGANGATVACWSLTGANQGGGSATFPHSNHASGQTLTASVTIPSASGNFVISAVTTDGNKPIDSISGTPDFILNDATGAAGSHTAGASSVTSTAMLGSGYPQTVWAMASSDVAPGSPPPPPVPVVGSVSPNSGPPSGATPVTISGSGFTGATSVMFGSVLAQFSVSSDTAISATSPAESAGTVDVTVTTPNGTSQVVTADKFTYVSPQQPAVTGVSPNSGATAGGTSVVITGSSFTGATAVNFGGVAATSFAVNSDTQITATDPAEAAGTVDVTVTTANGTSVTSGADQFTYQAPPPGAPTVTSVTPNNDAPAGGDTVVIMGTNFTNVTGVNFGSVAVPFSNIADFNSTTIIVPAPAGAAGTVDITVINGSGTSVTTAADKFTYGPPPTIPPIPATATRPAYNTGNGFFVVGRGVYDANGNLFTPIGANRQHYDASEPTRLQAKPNVERLMPFFNQDWVTVNKPLMDEDVTNNVVPIPTVFYTNYTTGTATTGSGNISDLNTAVGFWTSQAANWTTYNNIAMFNIANEWGPCSDDANVADYQTGYLSAVPAMRQAGYTGPLVVDAGCSGQGADMLVAFAASIEAADPLHNVVFSIHSYGSFYWQTPLCQACGFQFSATMDTLAQLNVPVIIGEFGCANCVTTQPSPVTSDEIMQAGEMYQFGWLAWSWDDNGDGCALNLLGPCPNNTNIYSYSDMSAYGRDVITSAGFGMQAVSVPATVFPQ